MKQLTVNNSNDVAEKSSVDYAGETAKYSVYGSLIAALIFCIATLV